MGGYSTDKNDVILHDLTNPKEGLTQPKWPKWGISIWKHGDFFLIKNNQNEDFTSVPGRQRWSAGVDPQLTPATETQFCFFVHEQWGVPWRNCGKMMFLLEMALFGSGVLDSKFQRWLRNSWSLDVELWLAQNPLYFPTAPDVAMVSQWLTPFKPNKSIIYIYNSDLLLVPYQPYLSIQLNHSKSTSAWNSPKILVTVSFFNRTPFPWTFGNGPCSGPSTLSTRRRVGDWDVDENINMPRFLILNLGDPIDYLILVLEPNEKMALPSFRLPDRKSPNHRRLLQTCWGPFIGTFLRRRCGYLSTTGAKRRELMGMWVAGMIIDS